MPLFCNSSLTAKFASPTRYQFILLRRNSSLAQSMHDHRAADRKCRNCAERHRLGKLAGEMENIRKQCQHCASDPNKVQPLGGSQGLAFLAIVKRDLQEKSSQTDRSQHYYRKGAAKRAWLGVDNHQGQKAAQNAGSNHRPAPRLLSRVFGRRFRHAVILA